MRRIISYFFIVAALLAVVFFINGARSAIVQDNTSPGQMIPESNQANKNDPRFFDTHLPVITVNTGGQGIEKESETWAEISVTSPRTNSDGSGSTQDFTAAAVIKYRGSSSHATFDKKQYRIEFRKGRGEESNKSYPVMGMSPGSDWVLNGPFLDRSLVRNRIIYTISREMLSWAPDTRYCELFLNGEYQGLYLMVEPITNEKGRLNLSKFGLLSGQTAYVLQRDRYDSTENIISTYGSENGKTSYFVSISFPTSGHLTEVQRQWIQKDISEFERVLYSDSFDDPDYGYSSYIDVASFVDYYIINEFTLTTDAGYLSTFVYKDIEGKLKATVWDFNNSYNNYAGSVKSTDKFYVAESNWYNRLLQDKRFTAAVVSRYKELRKGVLSEENMLRLVDENAAYLGDAVERNFAVWGYTFHEQLLSLDEQGNKRDPRNYGEAIQQLKNSIIERGNFMDQNIEELYRYAIN